MTAGAVVWICGLPASGKTTLAKNLVAFLRDREVPVMWLDGDDLRAVMTPEPTYSDEERERFYGTLGHLARRAAEGGVVAVVSATAAKRRHRDRVRADVPCFVEVWLRCDDGELRRRDPKGLYRAAAAGQVAALPGVGTPFEEPEAAEIVLHSDQLAAPDLLGALVVELEGALGPELGGCRR